MVTQLYIQSFNPQHRLEQLALADEKTFG